MAAVSTSKTSDDREICNNKEQIWDLIKHIIGQKEVSGEYTQLLRVWANQLADAKALFNRTCSILKADLAFEWIGFIFVLAMLVLAVVIRSKRGARAVSDRLRDVRDTES